MKAMATRIALVVIAVAMFVGVPVLDASSAAPAQSGVSKFLADVAIQGAFENVIRRSPDESEKRRYRVRILEDHWTQRDIEDDLRDRGDYRSYDDRRSDRGPSRLSDREIDRIIEHAYQDILGRQPDSEGMRTYRNNIIERGWTERQVRDALRESQERRGNPHAAADRIIRHSYQEVLRRDPDTHGLYEYRDQVENHGWDEHDVMKALRSSPEARQKSPISDGEARAIVRRAYLSVLGREPDPASQGFVDRVMRDHWTEREVARELRQSEEYRNKGR